MRVGNYIGLNKEGRDFIVQKFGHSIINTSCMATILLIFGRVAISQYEMTIGRGKRACAKCLHLKMQHVPTILKVQRKRFRIWFGQSTGQLTSLLPRF